MTERQRGSIPEWAWIGLTALLVFCVWWRGHTFGPAVRDRTNAPNLWPVMRGQSEPLDCDEAAYAYMGRRLLAGDVLYRDLAENKPPGGYWIYALAVKLGGANEWTVRLLPIPIVLLTLMLLWRIGIDIKGPAAGIIATFLYILLSTDPYLYGNGAQLELPINLFSTAALLLLLRVKSNQGALWALAAGIAIGLATLVRQTAVVNLFVGLAWMLLGGIEVGKAEGAGRRRVVTAVSALVLGFVGAVGVAIGIICAQGAGPAFFEQVIQGGAALVTDTPAPPNAPPMVLRWLTGNADPRGILPPPFGATNYLVWWGSGSWPLWIASIPAVAWLLLGPGGPGRKLMALWCLSAWVQVVLPRQYWAHYYLLPTPSMALCIAVWIADMAQQVRELRPQDVKRYSFAAAVCIAMVAIAATFTIQTRDYLLVRSDHLTIRYKGGAQWVRLRAVGMELRRRAMRWRSPKLLVWGWQSPLYIYSGLDSPSRHFFVNDLMRRFAGKSHPLVGRWTRELMQDVESKRPLVIFTGYAPFPELEALIREKYDRSTLVPEVPAAWVRREDVQRFDSPPNRRRATLFAESPVPERGIWAWLPIPEPQAAQPSAAVPQPSNPYKAIDDPRN